MPDSPLSLDELRPWLSEAEIVLTESEMCELAEQLQPHRERLRTVAADRRAAMLRGATGALLRGREEQSPPPLAIPDVAAAVLGPRGGCARLVYLQVAGGAVFMGLAVGTFANRIAGFLIIGAGIAIAIAAVTGWGLGGGERRTSSGTWAVLRTLIGVGAILIGARTIADYLRYDADPRLLWGPIKLILFGVAIILLPIIAKRRRTTKRAVVLPGSAHGREKSGSPKAAASLRGDDVNP